MGKFRPVFCCARTITLGDVWEQIKGWLAGRLSDGAYRNWLCRTSLESFQGGRLVVCVPDETTESWIEQEYSPQIRSAIQSLGLPVHNVSYQVSKAIAMAAYAGSTSVSAHTVRSGNIASPATELVFEDTVSWLNPRLTFENYVVGSSNQFAHAAAQAVAKRPSRHYNPLFIYGGVGIGKTHLMHAMGRSLIDNFSGLNVVYTSSERFMNEMIKSIKLDRMALFHRHYRTADVLLIDDIQIIAGKERTQEEFFHTFNELYDHQKQLVISSDAVPNKLPGLVERLRSRFEWGLMVDVQPPDLETKMAILDKRAEAEGVTLPQDVRIFIATKTKSNVRELEGALTRLIAVSSLTGQPVTLAMAHQTLKHLAKGGEKRITLESIIRAVGEHVSILQPVQIKAKSNTRADCLSAPDCHVPG